MEGEPISWPTRLLTHQEAVDRQSKPALLNREMSQHVLSWAEVEDRNISDAILFLSSGAPIGLFILQGRAGFAE